MGLDNEGKYHSVKSRSITPTGGGHGKWEQQRLHTPAYGSDWYHFAGAEGDLPSYHGSEFTYSIGHNPENISLDHGDEGGYFYNVKKKIAKPYKPMRLRIDPTLYSPSNPVYKEYKVDGNFVCSCPVALTGSNPTFPSAIDSSSTTLNAWGTKAIDACKPTSGGADLSVALGELVNEGLPSVIGLNSWRDKTFAARNAGDEYLNVEFGWVPLVSDLSSFMSSVKNSHSIMEQYVRDMGKPVRRRFNFPEIATETTTLLSSNKVADIAPGGGTTDFPSSTGGSWYRTERTVINRWFSGAFVYGTPLQNENVTKAYGFAQSADQVLGLSLTPDVLWNLSPWSWAIDWAWNIGNVLSYTSDAMTHGLVMRYGYMMEHTSHIYEYNLVGATCKGMPLPTLTSAVVTETKKRIKANPFGFGSTWAGLSAAQWAILAALGVSRT